MRHLVWRDSKDEPWKTYGINRMHFGDRPAAAGLEVAKKKVAELGRSVDGQTADIIMRGYVDDGLGEGDEHIVKKLIREELFDSETGNLKEAGAGGVSHASPSNPLQSLSPPKPRYMVDQCWACLGTLVRTRYPSPWKLTCRQRSRA